MLLQLLPILLSVPVIGECLGWEWSVFTEQNNSIGKCHAMFVFILGLLLDYGLRSECSLREMCCFHRHPNCTGSFLEINIMSTPLPFVCGNVCRAVNFTP